MIKLFVWISGNNIWWWAYAARCSDFMPPNMEMTQKMIFMPPTLQIRNTLFNTLLADHFGPGDMEITFWPTQMIFLEKMDSILCLWILCHFKLNIWLKFLMWTHFMYEIYSAPIFSGSISEDNPWTIWILNFKSSTHGRFVGIYTIWLCLISYLWICIGGLPIEIPSS